MPANKNRLLTRLFIFVYNPSYLVFGLSEILSGVHLYSRRRRVPYLAFVLSNPSRTAVPSRLGDKPFTLQLACQQNGTAVLLAQRIYDTLRYR